MENIFLSIFNMSVSACWFVLAIVLLRVFFKKAPKWIICLLWGLAGLRLIIPFSLESVFSLVPSNEFLPQEMVNSHSSVSVSGSEILEYIGRNPVFYDLGIEDGRLVFNEICASDGAFINPLQIFLYIASIIWVVGIAALTAYSFISYLRLKKKVETAVLLRDNIFQSEQVESPFVLGVLKPKIYLPFDMKEKDVDLVITHEQAHIRRKDHLWKPLGFLVLTLHWFNPLVWLGYVMLCKDIELACDEKVIKGLNTEQRADYSQALLLSSVNRRMIVACPVAFGEIGVKGRVKSVLNYKKPAFWIIVLAVISSIVVGVCFLTGPKAKTQDLDEAVLKETDREVEITVKNDKKHITHEKAKTVIDYPDIIGLWGKEDGTLTIRFDNVPELSSYTGLLSYYENGKLEEDNFVYTLSSDASAKTAELRIIVDDYSEVHTVKLNNNVLTLMWFDKETNSEDKIILIKNKELIVPESTSGISTSKEPTTTIHNSSDNKVAS